MQYYAPTEPAADNDKDELYSRLNAVYGNTPRENIVIVMSDLKAKVDVGNSAIQSSDVPPFEPTAETISPARSIPQTPPSKSEIVSAIKSFPSGKAAEIGGIPAEFYKSNPYMAAAVLQPILEKAWLSEAFTEEFTNGIIPKKI